MSRRLLVWETHHLGDAVMSLPFLRAAASRFQVTLVCRPSQTQIYRLLPADSISILEWEPFWTKGVSKGASVLRLLHLLRQVRSLRCEYGVSVWADVRVHLLLFLAGINKRVGYPMDALNFYGSHLPWRSRQLRKSQRLNRLIETVLRRPLLSHPIQRKSDWSHIDTWTAIAHKLDLAPNFDTPWFELGLPHSAIKNFVERERSEGREIWIIHPGARTASKRWPIENFHKIVSEVLLPNGKSVLMLDEGQSATFTSASDHFATVNSPSMKVFVALMGSADSLLCNDSLPAHIGAALGLRVWSIFSSSDAQVFAPFNNAQRVLTSDVCEFRPCMDHCLKSRFECLEAINIDYVKRRLLQSFSQPSCKTER